MHYSYEGTVLTTNTVTNPKVVEMKLGAGILKRVVVDFPAGCNKHVKAFIMDRAVQVLPTNPEGFYSYEDYKVTADVYIPISTENNTLWLYAWNVDASWPHTISCLLDVESPDEPNIYRVLESFSGLLERFIDLLRRAF